MSCLEAVGNETGDRRQKTGDRRQNHEGTKGRRGEGGCMERKAAQKFQDLIVWQKSHALVLAVYKMTSRFPREELFGLTSQMRRSAVSVAANIAEGFKRRGKNDKVRVLNIAEGSLEELRYFLILSGDLGYAPKGVHEADADEIARMLSAYIRTIAP